MQQKYNRSAEKHVW